MIFLHTIIVHLIYHDNHDYCVHINNMFILRTSSLGTYVNILAHELPILLIVTMITQ